MGEKKTKFKVCKTDLGMDKVYPEGSVVELDAREGWVQQLITEGNLELVQLTDEEWDEAYFEILKDQLRELNIKLPEEPTIEKMEALIEALIEADAIAKAEAESKAKAEAQVKAEEERLKAEAEAKAEEEKLKAEAEAKAKAEEIKTHKSNSPKANKGKN